MKLTVIFQPAYKGPAESYADIPSYRYIVTEMKFPDDRARRYAFEGSKVPDILATVGDLAKDYLTKYGPAFDTKQNGTVASVRLAEKVRKPNGFDAATSSLWFPKVPNV